MDPFYRVMDLPPLDNEAMEEFGKLPFDPYTGGRQRHRRFSQYRISYQPDTMGWTMELLPHRPFLQPKAVNQLVGGVQRELEPLRIDPTPQIDAAAKGIGLDPAHDWHVNVHQCRVSVGPDIEGVSVPEGPHRDGHDYAMLVVFGRHNIKGGENQLMPTNGGEPFFRVTLQPNPQALAFDDTQMWHTATDLESLDGGPGHRDLWIVVFNRWDRRKYGEEFERAAVAKAAQ
ncbi:2OG-Fe dioxygenase family protein [Streptomyces sp. KR80]|uniref:2OG-Fe dioxygenase family protein n=1 Tax=Streptomyces sp. KR80 TaxID=3457426 RepID=UPI003FD2BCDE